MWNKILILEDDPDIVSFYKVVLETMDIQGVVPEKITQVFKEEFWTDNSFDAVMLDLAMPVYSGADVLDFIDTIRDRVKIPPIVIASADSFTMEKLKAKYPFVSTLLKPFGPSDILHALDGV